MLATATLEVGGAVVVVSTDTGGVDVATAGGVATGVVKMLVLVKLVFVDVEVEDELLELELELVLELVLELELLELLELAPLDSCALTVSASFEMAEWHCAIAFPPKLSGKMLRGFWCVVSDLLFWLSQSDTLNVALPLFAIVAQLFFWLSQLLPAASVKLVKVSPPTSKGRCVSPDWVTFFFCGGGSKQCQCLSLDQKTYGRGWFAHRIGPDPAQRPGKRL